MITRRSFIERLGLGVGASVLTPIASTLLLEAQGHAQTGARKRAAFFVLGDCMHHEAFTPGEFRTNSNTTLLPGSASYTIPAAFKNLEPHRNRMLLIDGLAMRLRRSQHSGGYGALSGFTSPNDASNEYAGPPGGITIDQFVAGKLGQSTKLKSVLVGQHKSDRTTVTFATGPNRPEPHFVDPQLMWQRVFEGVNAPMADPAAAAAAQGKINARRTLLLDAVRTDIKRLRGNLAGPEQVKLDHYIAAIEEYDQRASSVMPVACSPPPKPGMDDPKMQGYREARFNALVDMSSIALICGLTNVVGVAGGTGFSHGLNIFPNIGHEYPESLSRATTTYNMIAGKIAKLISTLSGLKEGDRTAWDNSVIIYTSDNGETHHSNKRRWPIVVLGTAGGKLKADGRFMRFPMSGMPRSLADLYATVAVALDVPGGESFGKGGVEVSQGPIAELL